MRRKNAFKALVTILLLGYLFFKVDRALLQESLRTLRLQEYLLSYAFCLLSILPAAARTHLLLKPSVISLSVKRLAEILLISQFYSIFLPSGFGLQLVRWYKVTQNRRGRRLFALITLTERVMLLMTLFLAAALFQALAGGSHPTTLGRPLIGLFLILAAPCLLYLSVFVHQGLQRHLAGVLFKVWEAIMPERFEGWSGLQDDIALYRREPFLFVRSYGWHLLFHAANYLRVYYVFTALWIDLPPVTVFWLSTIVHLLMVLPISVAGFGVREGGFAGLLPLYGLAAESGAAVGALLSLHVLANAGIGGVLALMEKDHDAPAPR